MQRYISNCASALAIGIATILCAPNAAAQSAPADQVDQADDSRLQDIVVTAQRREETLQQVPIAIAVASAASLQSKGIEGLVAISAAVPGLEFSSVGSAATIYLRGVGSSTSDPNAEPSVAVYVDGVYIAAAFASLTSLNNVERVEVLKGPQGTLFGRNATGGVVQVITRDPRHDPSADLRIGYGNYDTISGSLYGTTGLSPTVAMDVAVHYRNQMDGFGQNLTINKDTNRSSSFAIRSKLLWEPSEATSIRLTGDYSRDYNSRADFVLPKGTLNIDGDLPPAGAFDSVGDHINFARTRQGGASLRIDHEADSFNIVSISAYRRVEGLYSSHADATAPDFITVELPQKQWNVSQEFQLVSPAEASFDWVLGAFYYRSRATYDGGLLSGRALGGGSILFDTTQTTESLSGYGQATYEVVPRLKLTGGLRFTHENQKISGTVTSNLFPPGFVTPLAKPTGFDKLTWRAAANYEITDRVSTYISYNRGVKSGGFNLLGPSDAAYKPENLDAYEIGLKSELFDRRLRLNLSAFRYDYKNIQFQVVQSGSAFIANAAAARIKGVDLDFEAVLFRNFTLSGGATYLSSKYLRFPNAPAFTASPLTGPPISVDGSGERTIYTPKFSGTISADYTIPLESGKINMNASLYRNSGSFFQAAPYTNGERFFNPAHNLLSASIGWSSEGDGFSARIWGANLTNDFYYLQGSPSGNGYLSVRADPRTYGITLGAKF